MSLQFFQAIEGVSLGEERQYWADNELRFLCHFEQYYFGGGERNTASVGHSFSGLFKSN